MVATFFVARAIPPWYPIGTWWGDFLTSAGFGGTLAVIGAGTASFIAYHNSQADRVQKSESDRLARDQKRASDEQTRWWERFAWACEQALSTDPRESLLGRAVLSNLIQSPLSTDDDIYMTVDIIQIVDPEYQLVADSADDDSATDDDSAADGDASSMQRG